MATQKHLTLQDRMIIEKSLCIKEETISHIAKQLDKDPCTIKREILKHRIENNKPSYGKSINNCTYTSCCPINKAGSYFCNEKCEHFEYASCTRRDKKHLCCNGCEGKRKCILTKYDYNSTIAQNDYKENLKSCREGINLTEEELNKIGTIINKLVKEQGQSINAVIKNNSNDLNICSKTLYNYVNMNLFQTRNIHLARKVRFAPRKNKVHHKIDRNCTKGRTYDDFLEFMEKNPGYDVVEGDSVEGKKGTSVLLTLYFRSCGLQLSFKRESNNASSVISIIDDIYLKIGHDNFTKLFPIILLDNGTEFSNPDAIENYYSISEETKEVVKTPRTNVFYCNPSAPYQKGACERNHEFIRYFVPKGKSFNDYSQEQINLMMNHINSYIRGEKKNFKSPAEKFLFLYGEEVASSLNIELLNPNDVVLNSSIFKK